MVAMNKLSSLLGQSSRMASKGASRSVACEKLPHLLRLLLLLLLLVLMLLLLLLLVRLMMDAPAFFPSLLKHSFIPRPIYTGLFKDKGDPTRPARV